MKRNFEWVSLMKLPGHRPGLPGKVISFHIVPLDPAHRAGLAGHVPVKGGGRNARKDITQPLEWFIA